MACIRQKMGSEAAHVSPAFNFVWTLSLFAGVSVVLDATMVGATVARSDWVNAVDIGSAPKSPRSKLSAVDIRHK